MQVFITGGFQGSNCNGSASLSASLKDGSNSILQTGSTSGANSFQSLTLTYSISSLPADFKLSATGTANCNPPSGSANMVDQLFTINSGNVPLTCGGIFSFNKVNGSYVINATVSITSPFSAPIQASSFNVCDGSPIQLSVSDSAPSFNWQVSENGINYVTFRTASSSSITATTSELNPASFTTSRYTTPRKVRAVGTNCNGIRISAPATVSFYPPAPVIDQSSKGNSPVCPGGNDGSILINHSTIVAGASYIYTVIQWVNAGCPNPAIALPDGITAPPGYCALYKSNATNATGSSAFTLNNNNMADNVFKFKAGKYSVKVEATSAQGLTCYDTKFFDITDPPVLSISKSSDAPPSCLGGNDGSAAFVINNGVGGFNWAVDGGTTNDIGSDRSVTVSGLIAGNHSLTVTDVGCNKTATFDFTINAGADFLITNIYPTDPTCLTNSGGNGSITAIATSVTGKTYSYYLYPYGESGNNYESSISGQSNTYTFDNLSNSDYYIKVVTSNNCTANSSTIALSPPSALNAGTSTADATCAYSSDGKITITGISKTSGLIDYAYLLKDDLDAIVASGSSTSPSGLLISSSLSVDRIYNLTVNDNCKNNVVVANFPQNNIKVSRPSPISISNPGNEDLICFDGLTNANITVQGGGFSDYALDVKDNNISLQGYPKPTQPMGSFVLNSIGVGSYQVVATENCPIAGVTKSTSTIDFSITSNATSSITTAITKLKYSNNFDLSCAEKDDGRIQVEVSGGVQGTMPRYSIELLNSLDNPLVNNTTNNNNSSGIISDGVEGGGKVTYEISRLTESIDYKVRVRDYNSPSPGCSKKYDITPLTSPPPLTISGSSFSNLGNIGGLHSICKGDANGSYTAQISGGNPKYTAELFKKTLASDDFPITPFQAVNMLASGETAAFNNLGAGFYQLNVIDQQACIISEAFEIKDPPELKVDEITAFKYENGFNTSCYAGNNGKITVTASGGVGKYTYILSWYNNGPQSKSGTINTFTGLSAIRADGTVIKYTIGLMDELGCVWQSGNPSSDLTLTSPEQLKFYRSIQSNTVAGYEIPCKGDNATVRFTSEGGWLPHYVTINNVTKSITSASPYVEFILPAGNYTATFMDALNCTASSQSFNLLEPSSHIAISIGTIIPPVCIGGSDGQVNVSASGGVTGGAGQEYTFHLRDHLASAYNKDSQTGNNKTFLRPANDYLSKDYDAIAIDAYGCTSEASFTMPANPTPLTLTTNELVSPSCYGGNNGYITVKSTNQTYINGNELKFKIIGGHYGNTIQEVLVASDTYTFTNLEATDMPGYIAYKAWVEDANACVMEAYQYQSPLELPSYEPLQLNLLQSIRPSCFNGSDGSLYIQVSGGVPAYQYSRDNITFYPISDKIFTNQLTAGQYTYYLKDSNYDPTQPKCLNTTQFVVPVGRALRLETAITNISCKGGNDGSIDLTVNLDNRNANENFDLNRLSLAWINNTVSSIPFSTAEDVYALTRGTYTVKALYDVDSLVCSQQKTVNVLEPSSAFRITEVKTYQASCGGYSDGKAVVTWAGGWPNSVSHYKVDNGAWQSMSASSFVLTGLAPGSHQVEIAQQNFSCTDIKIFEITTASLALTVSNIIKPSCPFQSDGAVVLSSLNNGVEYALENGTFQQLPSFTGLAAGTYQFTARKSNDPTCVSGTIEAAITDPLDCGNGPLSITLLSTSVATCNASSDGSAQVLAGGGVPHYRFYWDGSNIEGAMIKTNLAVGSHSVSVKDATNITQTLTFEISAYEALGVEEFTSLASCVTTCDGVVQLVVTGGSGQYVINWSDGATGATRNNLCVGNYSYTITDGADINNKCFLTGDVTIDHYPSLVLSQQNAVAPTCPGGTDGYVSVAVEGGNGQYQLQWTINNNVVSNETTLSGVAPGTFSFTATDRALGCSMSQDFTIPDALPISVTSTDITPPSCNGGTDGRVALTLSNAPSPLVQWSNGQVGLTTTGIKAGTYQYTITSTAGCSITGSVVLTDRQQLQVSTGTVVPTCFGMCDGEAALNITGGTTPYAITWAHGPNTLTAKNLCAGTYAYTVSDKFNCSIKSSVVVATPDPVTIALVSKQDASCNGVKDGKLEVTATGGTGALSYLWNTGITTSALSDVGAGDYKVSVNDVNACIARKTFSITEPTLLLVKDEVLTNPSCPASTDGKISLSGTGGTTPYQYQWTDQVVSSSRSGLSAGDYALNVTDSKGCSISKKYTLRAPLPVEIVNVTKKDPSCFGYQDGQITLEATGGKAPYSFSWTNGSTNSSASTLVAGNYSVTVKDVNNCTVTGSYTLIDPIAPVITGIAANTVICTGSTLVVQPNGTWSRYEWKSPQGQLFTTPRYETNILGTHTLTAWDQRNCPAETSFVIEVSDNALKADFLRLSEAVVYKPVVFVDISTPVPTKIEWVIPGDVVVNRKTNEMVEVVFTNPGLYDIGIHGSLDRCQSELFKTVEVTEEKDNKGGRVASSDAEKVDVFIYPNPASNEMSIQVSSYSRSEIVLRLLTSLENRQVAYERLDGQLDYLVRWDVSALTPGVFFLVYEQGGKIYSKRVLVVR